MYVAFVIDAFSRRIVGWKADTTMKTSLVLDTLEMALWTRDRAGMPISAGLIHHHDAAVNTPALPSPGGSLMLATLEWVDWFNHARLHSACGRLSPAQYEQRYIDNFLNQ